ncbi:uncharacterized protein LOC113603353 isoform X2 [Acinonyx jubatus]|uniref:Uncharacterized protein LOC113603353 isoform X2 n=1 Tax=Acinonyx jubatus TaxID=32536 RepID=A0A6J2AIV7_ACIJB|nr:uncharacterized protein LOC113603353 isoform X2 [Acinonyx jubatus]
MKYEDNEREKDKRGGSDGGGDCCQYWGLRNASQQGEQNNLLPTATPTKPGADMARATFGNTELSTLRSASCSGETKPPGRGCQSPGNKQVPVSTPETGTLKGTERQQRLHKLRSRVCAEDFGVVAGPGCCKRLVCVQERDGPLQAKKGDTPRFCPPPQSLQDRMGFYKEVSNVSLENDAFITKFSGLFLPSFPTYIINHEVITIPV